MASIAPDDSGVPPAKRPRIEGETSVQDDVIPSKAVTHSSRFWFDDGNIVIVANGTVAYRIHRGILARHSVVFRDLFEVPQSGMEAESIYGCPQVEVFDPPEDFVCLLRALDDGAKTYKHGEQLDFHTVAALVELGHKYNVEHVRADALARMRTCFPHRFRDFEQSVRFSVSMSGGDRRPVGIESSVLRINVVHHAIRAVGIIRLIGGIPMLPMAFYLCTLLPISTIISGTTTAKGRAFTLSSEDQIRCIEARVALTARGVKKRHRVNELAVNSETCLSDNKCLRILQAQADTEMESRNVDLHPVVLHDPKVATIHGLKGLCEECAAEIASRQREETRFVWEKLPADLALEIPEWNATAVQ